MKIALDATYSAGEHLSGVGVYSREILWGLARTDYARWVWCYRPHRFLRSWKERLPSGCRRGLLFDSRTPGADLFHGLNQRLPKARLRQAVVTFHDLFVMTGDYSTPEFRARFTEQAREAASRADHIIAVSAFTASQVHDLLGVANERITVTHHGVRFREFPARSREQLVLCVGALQKRKNMTRLVRAFRALPAGGKLVLAGAEGDESGEVVRAIEESPRRGDITRTGWISDVELADYYARARIFAFPSLDEGFGIPVLEAMMAGLPVLTSNRSALPEVAGEAALLVDPWREDEIANGLQRLVSDESLRAQLISRGHERVKQFRWDRTVTQTVGLYKRLLGVPQDARN